MEALAAVSCPVDGEPVARLSERNLSRGRFLTVHRRCVKGPGMAVPGGPSHPFHRRLTARNARYHVSGGQTVPGCPSHRRPAPGRVRRREGGRRSVARGPRSGDHALASRGVRAERRPVPRSRRPPRRRRCRLRRLRRLRPLRDRDPRRIIEYRQLPRAEIKQGPYATSLIQAGLPPPRGVGAACPGGRND